MNTLTGAIESLLMSRLSLTGNKVFLGQPASRAQVPFLVVTERGASRPIAYGGGGNTERASFTVNYFARNHAALTTAQNIIWGLNGWSGTVNSRRIISTEISFNNTISDGTKPQAIFTINIIAASEVSVISPPVVTPVSAPTNFIITAPGSNEVILSWTVPDPQIDGAQLSIMRGTEILTTNHLTPPNRFVDSIDYDDNEGVDFTYTLQYTADGRTSDAVSQSITIPEIAPVQVNDLSVTIENTNSVRLTWSVPAGAGAQSTWTLCRGSTPIQEDIPRTTATSISYLDEGLMQGGTFNYKLSYTEDGVQAPVATASVSIPLPPVPAPENLVATAPGGNQIVLSWTRPVSLPASSIIIIRRGTEILEGADDETSADITTYTDTINYDNNEGAEISYSINYMSGNRASEIVMQSITIPTTNPERVTNFAAGVENGINVRLSWSVPVGAGAQSTWTLRRGTTIIQENIPRTNSISLSYLDTNLVQGQTYNYEITYTENGVTAPAATASVAIPLAPIPDPQNFTLTAPGGNEVILNWERPTNLVPEAVVVIYEGTNLLTNNLDSSITTFTHSVNYDDNEGVEFSYTIQFMVGMRTSQIASQSINIPITAPQAITGFTRVIENGNNIRFTWTVPAGAGAQSTWTLTDGARIVQENIPRTSDTTVSYLDENVPFGLHRYRLTYTEDGQTSPAATLVIILTIPSTSPPENFAISLPGSDQAILTWTNPDNYDEGNLRIRILVDGTGQPTTTLTDTLLYSATTFTHNFSYDDAEGRTFHYRINYQTPERTRQSTQITESVMIPITNPQQISDLTAAVENDNDVRLSWSVPAGAGAQSRWTLCRGTTVLQENILRTDATSVTYLDEDLTQGQSYTYKLSYTENGIEAPIANVAITVPLPGPNLGPVSFTDFTTRRSLSSGVRFSYDAFTPFTENGMTLPSNWFNSATFVGAQLRTNNNHRIYLPGLQPTDFFLTRMLRLTITQAGTTHILEGSTTFTNSNEAGFSASDASLALSIVTAIRAAFDANENINLTLELI